MDLPTDLSDAERKVVEHASRGKTCQLGAGEPSKGAKWGEERVVRASVIYALCCGLHDDWPVHAKGVRISGARIDGKLDFEDAVLQSPLHLLHCYIGEPMSFERARLPVLCLTGSYTHGIQADGLDANQVVLDNGFHAKDEVHLRNATITGDLQCQGGTFDNLGGKAMAADGLDCKGNVFLRYGFSAKGVVRLLGAKIGGNLECTRGTFENPEGKDENSERVALYADGLDCKGAVFLRQGFSAIGEVRLIGATIDGDLDCTGGTFENPEGYALCVNRLKCKGNLFFAERFSADGSVQLPGATFNGYLSLTGARVATLIDDQKSWPKSKCLLIDGFHYDQIEPADVKTRLEWIGRMPATHFAPQPYTQLATVLHSHGAERAASKILMAREKARAQRGPDPWWFKVWLRILGFTIGYGYQSWRALVILVFLWLLGWGIFSFDGVQRQIARSIDTTPVASALSPGDVITNPPQLVFHPFLYSLDVLVPVVNLQVEEDWTVHDGWVWWFMRAQIVLGWIFSTLAVLGFSGLVRKD